MGNIDTLRFVATTGGNRWAYVRRVNLHPLRQATVVAPEQGSGESR